MDHEILFIDDDSRDRSFDLLKEASQQEGPSKIRVIRTSRRFGVYPCLIAGLHYAKGDAVIYLETDLQDPPELIPQMIEKWKNGADVVHTTRTKRLGEGAVKLLITAWAYKAIQTLSEVAIPVNTGDFKLLSRRVIDEIKKHDEVDPYFRGMVSWVGFRQEHIYYTRDPRKSGVSTRSLMSFIPLKVFTSAILSTSLKPLVWLSLALLPLGFIFTTQLGVIFFGDPDEQIIRNFLWTTAAISIFILHVSIGVIGLYLARLLAQTRGRPKWVIKDEI